MSLITDLYTNLFGRTHIQDGTVIDMAEHGRVGGLSTGQSFKHVSIVDATTGDANPLPTGAATSSNQTLILQEVQKLIGFEIGAYDYKSFTYVTVGNGIGEIETITYKTGGSSGTTVATITFSYNSNGDIESITKT